MNQYDALAACNKVNFYFNQEKNEIIVIARMHTKSMQKMETANIFAELIN